MWFVFFVAAPQLQRSFEVRIRFLTGAAWDCMIFLGGQLQSSFSGDGDTSACRMFEMAFASSGVSGLVPAVD